MTAAVLAACLTAPALAFYAAALHRWRGCAAQNEFEVENEFANTAPPQTQTQTQTPTQTLTTLLPARNEAHRLPGVLADLQAQDPPVRVVVVDDGSTDGTADVAQAWGAEVVAAEGVGKKAALRTGMARYSTSWVVTLDADVRVQPGWSARVQAAIAAHPEAACLVLPVRLGPARTLLERLQALDFAAVQAWSGAEARRGRPVMASGANLAFRREVWPAEALRPEYDSGDDVFAVQALVAAGEQVVAVEDRRAGAEAAPAATWRELVAQRARWAGKAGGLADARVRRVGLGVAGLHGVLAALTCVAPGVGAAAWAAKWMLDARFLRGVARRAGVRFGIVEALAWGPWYAALVGATAVRVARGGVEWKGRIVRTGADLRRMEAGATVWQRFARHRAAVVGAVWIAVLACIALVGAPLRPDPTPHANAQHLEAALLPPGARVLDDDGSSRLHLLGTDRYGRDVLSRLMAGSALSLGVGAVAVLMSLVIGVGLGAWAGYRGGWVDAAVGYLIEVVWTLPTLLLVLAITLAFGKGFWQVFVAIGLTMWVDVARLVRGQFLSLREREFVEAARALGLPEWRIVFRHILPNALGPVIVVAASNFAAAILVESGLSFLGVGAQIPAPSWGNIVQEHHHLITGRHAWLALLPGALIASVVLAFTFVGDGLRAVVGE